MLKVIALGARTLRNEIQECFCPILLEPPHSNFSLASTTIYSTDGTFKCPQGPERNLDNCRAPGEEASEMEMVGTWRARALSGMGMGTLTLPQKLHGKSSPLLSELPIVISKARHSDFYATCSHF